MFNIFKNKNIGVETYTTEDIDEIIEAHNKLLVNYKKLSSELKLTQKRFEEIEIKRVEDFRNITDLIKKINLLDEKSKENTKEDEKSKSTKDLEKLLNKKIGI